MKRSQLKRSQLKQLIKQIIRESVHDVNPEFADGTVRPMPTTSVAEGRYDAKPCDCGSGQNSFWANDARGIPLKRVCPKCRDEKLKGYRQDVLDNPNYEADEPIEPDDYQEVVNEMSTTGGAAGYSTPFAFTKNKKGSPKGIEAAKKYGTVVGESPRV